MPRNRSLVLACALVATLALPASSAPFVLFPKAGQLLSPGGRFDVRNVDREGADQEFLGTFHALWLTELTTGRSRKLCDYVGVAAVAWSGEHYLIVTQYLNKHTSRALVFQVDHADDPVVLDAPTLIRTVPPELRPSLRENDHVFVEASRLEGDTLRLHVWGYGRHDANGFRWTCDYTLRESEVTCREERPPK